jgi:hypothetical protein
MLVDYLGGVDSPTEGIVIDGDEFFETEDDLLETDSESSISTNCFDDAIDQSILEERQSNAKADPVSGESNARANSISVDESIHGLEQIEVNAKALHAEDDDDNPGAVVLQDSPLPRLYVPGKVVHVYSHRGVYKAVYVPRTFREIRRISLAGNMLTDHKSETYYKGLLEVRTVRQASEIAPRWSAFDEDNTWYVNIRKYISFVLSRKI